MLRYLFCVPHTFILEKTWAQMIDYARDVLGYVHLADTLRPKRTFFSGRYSPEVPPHQHLTLGRGDGRSACCILFPEEGELRRFRLDKPLLDVRQTCGISRRVETRGEHAARSRWSIGQVTRNERWYDVPQVCRAATRSPRPERSNWQLPSSGEVSVKSVTCADGRMDRRTAKQVVPHPPCGTCDGRP